MADLGAARLALFDSQMSAAFWDLVGMLLWGSLIVSIVLTLVGLRLWSPWLLLVAAALSLLFTIPGSLLLGRWTLLLSAGQVTLAMIAAGSRMILRASE